MLQLHKRPYLYGRINLIQAWFERNDSAETTMPVMLEAVESTFHRSGSLTDSLVSPYSSCPVPRKCRHVAFRQRPNRDERDGAKSVRVLVQSAIHGETPCVDSWVWVTCGDMMIFIYIYLFYPFTAWHVWRYVSTGIWNHLVCPCLEYPLVIECGN